MRVQWLVAANFVKEGRTLLELICSGPDRAKARSVAEKHLRNSKAGTDDVGIYRVSRMTLLTREDLVSSLPRDSF